MASKTGSSGRKVEFPAPVVGRRRHRGRTPWTPSPFAPNPSPKAAADGDETGGNIEKVRDILFGSQMRDTDRRFSRLEDRLAQDTAD